MGRTGALTADARLERRSGGTVEESYSQKKRNRRKNLYIVIQLRKKAGEVLDRGSFRRPVY